jgi:prevent-host-death family protein
MNTYRLEFDIVQRNFEHWMIRIVAGDTIIVTVAGVDTAVLVPYADYISSLEASWQKATDSTTPKT